MDRIDTLQNEIDNLKKSSGIPRDIETAFRERLGLDGQDVVITYVSNVVLNDLGGGSYSLTKTTKTMTFSKGILISST